MQTKAQNFRAGLRDGLPICLGYFAVSFAFGIQAAGIGLSVPEAAAVSAANLTSAGQFAALGIIAAGASYLELAFNPACHQPAVFSDVLRAFAAAFPRHALCAPFRHRLRHDG